MKTKLITIVLVLMQYTTSLYAQKNVAVTKPSLIPVGYDAYRMWDKWYLQRPGVRAYMRSTYDRNGGNQSADASHFLFAKSADYNVTLDVKGKGILYFFRANHWHGSPWHFNIDGRDNLVTESATQHPDNAKKLISNSEFLPAASFPNPLAVTWATTKGADLIWTPMAFTDSLQIAYSRTKYGTGYYIYQLYADEDHLSAPIKSWDLNKTPDPDVVSFINKAGQDIAPQQIKKLTGDCSLINNRAVLANIQAANMVVRAFKLSVPLENADDLEHVRLVVTWDKAAKPSIDAPLPLFFGAGSMYNRDKKEFLVKACRLISGLIMSKKKWI